jgi:hypothetical protein
MLSFAACPLLTPKKHGISVYFQPARTERAAFFTGNTAETTDSGSVLELWKHCIKLVRKMRRQIFWQIVQKFRRQTWCLARDFWAI